MILENLAKGFRADRAGRAAVLASFLVTSPAVAHGQEILSAVCNDPEGMTRGFEGGKLITEPDRFRDTEIHVVIADGSAKVSTVQTSNGRRMTTSSQALVLRSNPRLVSVIVALPEALWVYSLYPLAGRAVITRATTGYLFDTTSAAGYLFTADCKFW